MIRRFILTDAAAYDGIQLGTLLDRRNTASPAWRPACSCGAAMPDCPLWSEVRSRLIAEGTAWTEARVLVSTSAGGLWRTWRAGADDPRSSAGPGSPAPWRRSPRPPASRTCWIRARRRRTPCCCASCRRRAIHLVRDPRAVLGSFVWMARHPEHLRQQQQRLAARGAALLLLRVATAWTAVQLASELMASAWPERAVRVRFEDLCAQPAVELARFGRAFGLDLANVADKAGWQEPLAVVHNIGGNGLRHAGSLRCDPGCGQQREPLPRWLALAIVLLCGPLMWRYGYRLWE